MVCSALKIVFFRAIVRPIAGDWMEMRPEAVLQNTRGFTIHTEKIKWKKINLKEFRWKNVCGT